MPFALRLACQGHYSEPRALASTTRKPSLLISYAYFDRFIKNRGSYQYRDWVLDCGAFTAFAAGSRVPFEKYAALCQKLIEIDPRLSEIYALDVIGDWKATLVNTEKLWARGIPAIPCFHVGEPMEMLDEIAKTYPKIAIGGVARGHRDAKIKWADACVSRVWPKKVHGFGIGFRDAVLRIPFHSVDASTWQQEPTAFGLYKQWGDGKEHIPVRGNWKKQNIRSNVEYYLDLEQEVNARWAKEMAELDAVSPVLTLKQQVENLKGATHA